MVEERKKECDPDDVVCQMEVLRHLEGLEEHLGNDKFLEKYPQLAGVKEQISDDVKKQKLVVQEAIDECGKEEESVTEPTIEPPIEETTSDVEPPAD